MSETMLDLSQQCLLHDQVTGQPVEFVDQEPGSGAVPKFGQSAAERYAGVQAITTRAAGFALAWCVARETFAMTTEQPSVPPGVPGHGRRLTPGSSLSASMTTGMIRNGWAELWEVICPDCDDRTELD